MVSLSAFADEISPDLDQQIAGCRANAVTHIELRGVDGVNVLEFTKQQRQDIKAKLTDAGLGVICIGSPIGKVKISDPWPPHFERFKVAVDAAEFFGAPLIRLFSYYPGPEGPVIEQRDEVMKRFEAKLQYVKQRPVTLVHENEKDIYGEKGAQCVDLMKTLDSPQLRTAFDFANFVQAGEKPLDNWPALKPYTVHIHIKDARLSDGGVVPAGQGDGQLAPILVDACQSGYHGFLSLEPHLAAHGQFSGFSGPDLFTTAADALKKLCRDNQIPLAGG